MRTVIVITLAALIVMIGIISASAQTPAEQAEKAIIEKYLNRKVKIETKKLGWVSASFTINRINRKNDYNKFASYSSTHFTDGSLSWLSQAKTFSLDFGTIISNKWAVSLSGEYWMTLGESHSGSFVYAPPDKTGGVVTDFKSEIEVWGASAAVQYYFYNHPTVAGKLEQLSLRAGGRVGYYQASWHLWPEYQNLNLATATYVDDNTTFKGTAPGFEMSLGADYPLKIWDMALGVDFGYLYLNFKNVAWYNTQDEEIVATYSDNNTCRVNLGLSGFRGKVELKRFFAW